MADIKNIHQRLNEVRKEVEYLKKEKKVESYMAVTHDQVTREVRKWFVVHGVSIWPTLQMERTVDTGSKTKGGTPIVRHEVVYAVAFVNIDQPDDRESVVVSAHANDQGDKAPGKALSYAVKSAILKVLMIETGENDESRNIDEVSPDSIVGLEEAMDVAATKEELQAALREAMAEAKGCNDRYAAKRFRAHADKIVAKKFNEFMPSEKKVVEGGAVAAAGETGQSETTPAAPPTPADEPLWVDDAGDAPAEKPAIPKARADVKLATAGMLTTVKKAMQRTGKSEEQLFGKFGFGSSAIPAEKINDVITWSRS